MNSLSKYADLIKSMGLRYILFRIKYNILLRTGLLAQSFPVLNSIKTPQSVSKWRTESGIFFFNGKKSLSFPKQPTDELKKKLEDFKKGKIVFFNSSSFSLGLNYDWITNPLTGYKYNINDHWTKVQDYSEKAGDIKFVWEKSRFCFIYDLIRYDYHFQEDCSIIVFKEIENWIDRNPVNCGPNYKCSQEISIRLLNWMFVLNYYKHSEVLSDQLFSKIENSIYWQVHHIYHNIQFSKIAVRNNHALTECLTLFLSGLLFPYITDFKIWGSKGKEWFEKEIDYQIYNDGTFLQYSMNYHRVVIQLLTWGIGISELNNQKFSTTVYDKAAKSLNFLFICMNEESGRLPNYGANDGALFFKLNDSEYNDYRPQLKALADTLRYDINIRGVTEDSEWYNVAKKTFNKTFTIEHKAYCFRDGGYYILREESYLTFIRCGGHKDRPSQADNLHLDIWYKGENILLDGGSYKYNTTSENINYFFGTASHNTVMIGNNNQMKKGARFTWHFWSQLLKAEVLETDTEFLFNGSINAFSFLSKNIVHSRKVIKLKGQPRWIIEDQIKNKPDRTVMRQIWNMPLKSNIELKAVSSEDTLIPITLEGWQSLKYGEKEKSKKVEFHTELDFIKTELTII